MKLYFPEKFNDYSAIDYFDNLQKKTQLLMKSLLGISFDKSIQENVDEYFDLMLKPKYLINDKKNEVILFEKAVEKTHTVMEDNSIENSKLLNVFEFYSKIEFLENKFKTNK